MKNPRKLIVSTLAAIAFGLICAGFIFVVANFDTMTEQPNFDEPIDISMLRPLPKAETIDTFLKFESECEKLTEQTGKQHKLVVGRYLTTKSEIRTISAGGQTPVVNIKMVFETDDGEIEVYTGFEDVGDEYEKRKEMLVAVVGEEHFFEHIDTDHIVGLCAQKNNVGKLTGKIEDLRYVGMR